MQLKYPGYLIELMGLQLSRRTGRGKVKKVESGGRKGVSVETNVKARNNSEIHESLAKGNNGFKLLNFNNKRESSDAGLITA